MQIIIMANQYINQRGYPGAVLQLPATKAAIEDTLVRAHMPKGGSFRLWYEKWPFFIKDAIQKCGEKSLEEVNLLAYKVDRMDTNQLNTYEGAIQLRQNADIDTPPSMKELINILYNLDSYVFHPGIMSDQMLGELCLMGELLDSVKGVSDDIFELLDTEKVGQELRRREQGEYTGQGYVFPASEACVEAYDGIHLPEQFMLHDGMISLRLESVCPGQEPIADIWLELPAEKAEMQQVLDSIGTQSFETCRIAEVKSVIPSLEKQCTQSEDIDMLNILAGRIQEFSDNRTLTKYKAILNAEVCSSLAMQLDIASNLECYDYNSFIITAEQYAEHVLQKAGIDTDDPAFSYFDYKGYGERCLQKQGSVINAYGQVSRNSNTFVPEYTKTVPIQRESVSRNTDEEMKYIPAISM